MQGSTQYVVNLTLTLNEVTRIKDNKPIWGEIKSEKLVELLMGRYTPILQNASSRPLIRD